MLHSFTPDAGSGDFTEVGGSGDVISGGSVMSVSENFSSDYGNSYRGLHASDEFKVSYAPVSCKIDMPPGWMCNFSGTWVNARQMKRVVLNSLRHIIFKLILIAILANKHCPILFRETGLVF